MANNSSKEYQVKLFLLQVKNYVGTDKIEWTARSNYDGFLALGLTMQSAEEIILQLTPSCYYRGPNQDLNGDGSDVWEFIYTLEDENIPVYIKLKIWENQCKVLSFHESYKPFDLPFSESEVEQ